MLGLDINSTAVRAVVLSNSGAGSEVLSASASALPAGLVPDSYANAALLDREGLKQAVSNCVGKLGLPCPRRAGLCLPDAAFRIQTLDFEELPNKVSDRERLIMWRLQKTAAFDLTDTLLRYQVLRRKNGFSVLACIAKKDLIAFYESLLIDLGIEPWSIAVSSLSVLGLYASHLSRRTGTPALTHVTSDSFATVVPENGGVRFYRFKDMKRGNADEIQSRLVREIEDSLHFYIHMDRGQQAEVGRLYLSGEEQMISTIAGPLSANMSIPVEPLSPGGVFESSPGSAADMSAAVAAGCAA